VLFLVRLGLAAASKSVTGTDQQSAQYSLDEFVQAQCGLVIIVFTLERLKAFFEKQHVTAVLIEALRNPISLFVRDEAARQQASGRVANQRH